MKIALAHHLSQRRLKDVRRLDEGEETKRRRLLLQVLKNRSERFIRSAFSTGSDKIRNNESCRLNVLFSFILA